MRHLLEARRPPKWRRLDNAAKIFPPTSHGADTGVFRLSALLSEAVDPVMLQAALDRTLPHFSHFLMVMRRGVFWYYLEQTTLRPRVVAETLPPCAPLYHGSGDLLFRVSYWRNKVNLEVYHVLADGTGGIEFFTALLCAYLSKAHHLSIAAPVADSSTSQREADSFQKYYNPKAMRGLSKSRTAFHLRGDKRADGGLTILEGVVSVREVLGKAHEHGATLTGYLTALMLQAIYEQMYVRDYKRPATVTVPVDLRSYFPSHTARNFFGTVRVSYDFAKQPADFASILAYVQQSLKAELAPERLAARLSRMASLEHNPILRVVPLVLKNPVLRFVGNLVEKNETVVLSNTGKLPLPEAAKPFVCGFSTFMSTHATQLCVCSCGDRLHLDFTSVFDQPELQRRFFTLLTAQGISVLLHSNEYQIEEASLCNNAPAAR